MADVFDAELPMLQRPLIVFLASTAVCSATVPVASKVNTSTVYCGWFGSSSSFDEQLASSNEAAKTADKIFFIIIVYLCGFIAKFCANITLKNVTVIAMREMLS